MADLTKRQAAFVEAFILCNVGAEAARIAGYSENSARVIAAKLLTHPNVKAAIANAKANLIGKVEDLRTVIRDNVRANVNKIPTGEFTQQDSWRWHRLGAEITGLTQRDTAIAVAGLNIQINVGGRQSPPAIDITREDS